MRNTCKCDLRINKVKDVNDVVVLKDLHITNQERNFENS